MSINFTISFDINELTVIRNTLMKITNPSPVQDRIGRKIDFIIEDLMREEDDCNDV